MKEGTYTIDHQKNLMDVLLTIIPDPGRWTVIKNGEYTYTVFFHSYFADRKPMTMFRNIHPEELDSGTFAKTYTYYFLTQKMISYELIKSVCKLKVKE